jgi:hypothetical protein
VKQQSKKSFENNIKKILHMPLKKTLQKTKQIEHISGCTVVAPSDAFSVSKILK